MKGGGGGGEGIRVGAGGTPLFTKEIWGDFVAGRRIESAVRRQLRCKALHSAGGVPVR